jgi:hypothetical protein
MFNLSSTIDFISVQVTQEPPNPGRHVEKHWLGPLIHNNLSIYLAVLSFDYDRTQ